MSHDAPDAIHIFNPFRHPSGGSPWRSVSLCNALRAQHRPVSLWAIKRPHTDWTTQYPEITPIGALTGRFPRNGTFIFVGPPLNVRSWFWRTHPRRIVMICNYLSKHRFERRKAQIEWYSKLKVDVVFTSQWIKDAIGGEGVVHYSSIDLGLFTLRTDYAQRGERFTVGRLSREGWVKFGADDPELFTSLVEAGCRIRIMGGRRLAERLAPSEHIDLIPSMTEDADPFLGTLDCFVYRTSAWWTEPSGRVVAEAMACGLPVVCENRGGYTEIVEHGVNGFLFETNEQAREQILRLKNDPELRARIGAAARKTVEGMFLHEALRETLDFYLR